MVRCDNFGSLLLNRFIYFILQPLLGFGHVFVKMTSAIQYGVKVVSMYVGVTAAYGFTRAVTYDYEKTAEYYNRKTFRYEHKEMLFTDKVGTILGKTCLAITAWPNVLGRDLTRLECASRGKDLSEYASYSSKKD